MMLIAVGGGILLSSGGWISVVFGLMFLIVGLAMVFFVLADIHEDQTRWK